MIPSRPQLHSHWWTPPNLDYSFKHTFAWPPPPNASADTVRLASTTTTEAAAASSGGAHLPPREPGMYFNHYGSYGRPRWCGGFGLRRFIWFGLGIGAATLYFRHKEQSSEYERRIDTPRSEGWCGHQEGNHRFDRRQLAPTPVVNESWKTTPPPQPAESSVLSTLSCPTKTVEPVVDVESNDRPRWGLGAHRRQRRVEAQAADQSGRQTAQMKDLEAAVERMWSEKTKKVVEAESTAKQLALGRMEKLSEALQTLRETLKLESEGKVERKRV